MEATHLRREDRERQTPLWRACRDAIQRLLVTPNAPRLASDVSAEFLTSTISHSRTKQESADNVALQEGLASAAVNWPQGESWTAHDTVNLMRRVLLDTPEEPPAATAGAPVLLFCAKVLANGLNTNPEESAPLPGATDGATLAKERLRDGVASTDAFDKAITVRKAYLTRLVGRHNIGVFAYGAPTLREVADEVLDAMLKRLDDETPAPARLLHDSSPNSQTHSSSLAADPGLDLPELIEERAPGGPFKKRSFKSLTILALAVILAVGVGAGVASYLAGRGAASSAAPTSPVVAEKAPTSLTWRGDGFWVPATAPISSLPALQNYCAVDGSSAADVKTAKAWLQRYGVPQYVPTIISVRNVSTSSDPVSVDLVTAHGASTATTTPAFEFMCPSANGGQSPWTDLNLRLTNGSFAVLGVPNPGQPDYFLWQMNKGANLEMSLTYSGEANFRGYLTMRVQQGRSSSTVKLPAGNASSNSTLVWRGIPMDKRLIVEPGTLNQGTFDCYMPGGMPGASRPVSCSSADVKRDLQKLWGSVAG